MKTAVIIIATLALAFAAPQARHKTFFDHFVDFTDLINNEVGHDVEHIMMDHYMENEEFQASLNFLMTEEFSTILREVRGLPEFQAIAEYLRNIKIDISEFIPMEGKLKSRVTRHNTSGKDFTSFLKDVFKLLPKDKIVALYEQKIAEDEAFKAAVEALHSEEFKELVSKLWMNDIFHKHVHTLAENGFDYEEVYNYVLELMDSIRKS